MADMEDKKLFDKTLAESAELRIRNDHNLNDFKTKELTFKANGAVKAVFENDAKKTVVVSEPEDTVYRYYYDKLVAEQELNEEEVPVSDFIRLYKGGIPISMMAEALR